MQRRNKSPAHSSTRFLPWLSFERVYLAVLLLILACVTWRELLRFFSDDDLMNMNWAWRENLSRLIEAQVMVWIPIYRPLGALVYRMLYAGFGFNPLPLYILSWILLLVNLLLSYRMFRTLDLDAPAALVALALTAIHGAYFELYSNAGTIYDRLWFLFTVAGIAVYVRARRRQEAISPAPAALTCLFSILALNSKEGGIVLPVVLACWEVIFIFPEASRAQKIRRWFRTVVPLYAALTILSLLFVFIHVRRTPQLAANPAGYRPHYSLSLWLIHVAHDFSFLAYRTRMFHWGSAAVVLVLTLSLAIALRNRSMIFGWLFFVVSVTPVSLLGTKSGYVLYVPDLGWGIYFGAAFAEAARFFFAKRKRGGGVLTKCAAVAVGAAIMAFHAGHWPEVFDSGLSPQKLLTDQFRREYPKMPPGSRLLFVSDYFDKDRYPLHLTMWLMYRDPSIVVDRMQAIASQQPDWTRPLAYDQVFEGESWRYAELDNRDVQQSIRLHILRNYSVGRETDFSREDHGAYIVSGVLDGAGKDIGRWTTPQARLKFDVYPAKAIFSMKFFIPDVVAKAPLKTLSVLVGGTRVGSVELTHDGMNEESFAVSPDLISPSGFTIVDLNVDKPYRTNTGDELGIVLLRAGFEYANRRPMPN